MRTVVMNPITPNINPFTEDQYHMGTKIGASTLVMHANYDHARCDYLIIIDIPTGNRVKVIMNDEHPDHIGDIPANLVNLARRGIINQYPK